MGAFGSGIWGMAPAYVAERYPDGGARRRSGLLLPRGGGHRLGRCRVLIGIMQDRGMALATAMTIAIAVALLFSASLMWFGPETRGRQLTAETH